MCCRSIGYYPFKKNDNFFSFRTYNGRKLTINLFNPPSHERKKKKTSMHIYYNGAKDGSLHEDNNEILSPPTLHCIFSITSSNE